MALRKDFMSILACPRCKDGVRKRGMFLLCSKCGLAYPVLNGDVPDLMPEDAWPLARARRGRFRHREKL